MEQIAHVQALEAETRVAQGASNGCGVICVVLVVLPLLARMSGWMPIESATGVWGVAIIITLFFTLLITTYLEYSLQPALDRAQNRLIQDSRRQVTELRLQQENLIHVEIHQEQPQIEQLSPQVEFKVSRLEQGARRANCVAWLVGILGLVMPFLILMVLRSIDFLHKLAEIGVPLLMCTTQFILVLLTAMFQCFYKPAIARAKSDLIAELQRQLADLQVLRGGT